MKDSYTKIKEMLKDGADEKDIICSFTDEIRAAQEEIKKEEEAKRGKEKTQAAIADARQEVIDSLIYYCKTLGFSDEDISQSKFKEEITSTLKELECFIRLFLTSDSTSKDKKIKATENDLKTLINRLIL